MKIIYLLRAGFGIAGEAASFHYASIMSKKHNVLVLTNETSVDAEIPISNNKNIVIKNIYAKTFFDQILNIKNEIKDFNPDIIHMIQSHYCFHYIYFLKQENTEPKWIIDFRSPHVGDRNAPAIKRYFYLQFYVDLVLTHSLASLKTNIPLRLVKAKEIPPGIDLSEFTEININKKNKFNRYIFIGSINKRRKLNFLIDNFVKFAKESKVNISLDIYGNGNDFQNLKIFIIEKNYGKFIFLKGAFPQNKLFKLIPTYDVGIAYVPYEFFNTAPSLKSLEYAASKIPIIASNTLGHQEYNKKYGFNFILFGNNSNAFISILEEITNNGISSEHIANNYNAVKKFDWGYIIGTKLQNIYKELLTK